MADLRGALLDDAADTVLEVHVEEEDDPHLHTEHWPKARGTQEWLDDDDVGRFQTFCFASGHWFTPRDSNRRMALFPSIFAGACMSQVQGQFWLLPEEAPL